MNNEVHCQAQHGSSHCRIYQAIYGMPTSNDCPLKRRDEILAIEIKLMKKEFISGGFKLVHIL